MLEFWKDTLVQQYRKLIVALIGAAIIAIDTFAGFSVNIGAEAVMTFVVPILTALGVWKVSNA